MTSIGNSETTWLESRPLLREEPSGPSSVVPRGNNSYVLLFSIKMGSLLRVRAGWAPAEIRGEQRDDTRQAQVLGDDAEYKISD